MLNNNLFLDKNEVWDNIDHGVNIKTYYTKRQKTKKKIQLLRQI